jgi:hypothetical protein
MLLFAPAVPEHLMRIAKNKYQTPTHIFLRFSYKLTFTKCLRLNVQVARNIEWFLLGWAAFFYRMFNLNLERRKIYFLLKDVTDTDAEYLPSPRLDSGNVSNILICRRSILGDRNNTVSENSPAYISYI